MLFIILICISHFVFCSQLIICYLFYIYFRLLEMRLDKKQIQAFFFFYLTSKWIVKNQRQLVTSAMHLAQELLTNVQLSGCSRTFAKKRKALTMKRVVACHRKLTTASWEPSLKLILYHYMRNCLRTQCPQFYGHLAFEANWKGEKTLVSGCLLSWPEIKKIII